VQWRAIFNPENYGEPDQANPGIIRAFALGRVLQFAAQQSEKVPKPLDTRRICVYIYNQAGLSGFLE
jgi:hypothetical protein